MYLLLEESEIAAGKSMVAVHGENRFWSKQHHRNQLLEIRDTAR